MVRACSSVEEGTYFYEVEVRKGGGLSAPPPTVESATSAPAPSSSSSDTPSGVASTPKSVASSVLLVSPRADAPLETPHVRLGFANRTADLQAPVGYDRWSYGYRDKGGSKVHQSRRDDTWGGDAYQAGDVVGSLIHLAPRSAVPSLSSPTPTGENYIQFFKNGVPCGKIVEKNGKTTGGVAFDISPGVYYPAASCYSGGRIRANFGPTFKFPPSRSIVKEFQTIPKAEKVASEAELLQKLHKQVSLKYTVAEKAKGRKKRMLNEVSPSARERSEPALCSNPRCATPES